MDLNFTEILDWSRSKKRATVILLDIFLAFFSMWLAFTLRLDALHLPTGIDWAAYIISPMLAVPVFTKFGLYRAIFRYTGMAAILATSKAVGVYGLALAPCIWTLFYWEGLPRSLIVLQPLIFLLLVSASRALGWQWLQGMNKYPGSGLLIYGAGVAGAQTAAALVGAQQYVLVGFIDDDPAKHGRTINGVPVFPLAKVERVVEENSISDILLALPSASRQRRNQIIGQLQALPVRIRSLPGLADLASGRVSVDDFRDLDIEDLLGRESVPADIEAEARAFSLSGCVVLVTGAGGSIGGELCRQISLSKPSKLLLVDHSEFALYRIHQELSNSNLQKGGEIKILPLLANVCNFERMDAICRIHKPSVVYHAAAYKHVPLVEANASEGVTNNVLGTLNMAHAAINSKVERFVLISTDKAVRPTNVMGASKRVAEMVLQSIADTGGHPFHELTKNQPVVAAKRCNTCFSMVRFGNVLGSSGSVVPLFRHQISEGGPITVTHPEVTRYFMTISEAVQLVLHAGAMAEGGDLFVLDMGQPVKILDLAARMIALSGRTIRNAARPTGDIAITFTGLRPGEKLFEELLIGENPLPTQHPRIIRAREDFMKWPALRQHLQELLNAARDGNLEIMKDALCTLVPGYAHEGV
ncbi:polysaccharide biosynthesis protein [Variovorax paradoxus]|uniref:polysaccharide biosynthesis protein n=1 Tax=Variovorax paradoxus TaxID=34073 RepID=UPI0029C6F1C6|nr:nucleoside-diphosphate sugar epimerase/dehydratase [Variovorax paradoxus]